MCVIFDEESVITGQKTYEWAIHSLCGGLMMRSEIQEVQFIVPELKWRREIFGFQIQGQVERGVLAVDHEKQVKTTPWLLLFLGKVV